MTLDPPLQGATIELSPPLPHSYVVKGVTILYSHPVHFYFNDHNQFESIFFRKK